MSDQQALPDETTTQEASPGGMHADFSDQTGLFDPNSFAESVHVIGLGGVGASLLPTLVTMGVRRFTLWDPDVVEPRNLASQLLYKPGRPDVPDSSDLYKPKVEVCRDYLLVHGATDVQIMPRLFTENDRVDGVVISGVDTMSARKEIWAAIKRSNDAVQFYLDGRIGGLNMTLLAVEPFDGEWYEKDWLFDDADAAPLPCTQRAIAYPAVVLGGIMASHLANWHRGNLPPKRVDFNLGDLFFQTVGSRR